MAHRPRGRRAPTTPMVRDPANSRDSGECVRPETLNKVSYVGQIQ